MTIKKWDVRDCLEQIMPSKNTHIATQFSRQAKKNIIKKEDVTDELLKQSYIKMAQIIDKYGDTYLPIFERLHNEIEQRKKQKNMLDIAKTIAKNKLDQSI